MERERERERDEGVGMVSSENGRAQIRWGKSRAVEGRICGGGKRGGERTEKRHCLPVLKCKEKSLPLLGITLAISPLVGAGGCPCRLVGARNFQGLLVNNNNNNKPKF